MARDAAYWIEKLGLSEHPEGGHYARIYRSNEWIHQNHLPARFTGPRVLGTAIYYLLKEREFSALHRLKSDEIWHFYAGGPLTLYIIDNNDNLHSRRLGDDPEQGESFQVIVEAGCWFGAVVDDRRSYALMGCTVAPGFEFEDFELGSRQELVQRYPQHRDFIERLTR